MSPGFELINVPTMVPIKADETTNPMAQSERLKRVFTDEVVPAITAVSKPNSNPPREETIEALIKEPVT